MGEGTDNGRVLLVGLGRLGRLYLASAHELGLAVSVVDLAGSLRANETQELLNSRDLCYPIAASTDEDWYRAASAAVSDAPVDGVIAFGEPHVVATALIAEELGLPGPGLRAAVVSRNKLYQRQLFQRRGLAQPEFVLARWPDEAAAWSSGRYPVVVKPLADAGSRGVQIIHNVDELARWQAQRIRGESFLIERRLTGLEYVLQVLVDDGRIVFSKLTGKASTDPPYRVEVAHFAPADVDQQVRKAIDKLAAGLLDALGMGSGVAHIDLGVEEDEPHVFEIGVRTPGDYLMDLARAVTGVDMYTAIVQLARGRKPTCVRTRSHAGYVWYPVIAPGRVTTVNGLEEVRRMRGVESVSVDVHVGTRIKPFRSAFDRVGAVLVCEQDPVALHTTLAKIRETLVVGVE